MQMANKIKINTKPNLGLGQLQLLGQLHPLGHGQVLVLLELRLQRLDLKAKGVSGINASIFKMFSPKNLAIILTGLTKDMNF
jgi:hypothetical protein